MGQKKYPDLFWLFIFLVRWKSVWFSVTKFASENFKHENTLVKYILVLGSCRKSTGLLKMQILEHVSNFSQKQSAFLNQN